MKIIKRGIAPRDEIKNATCRNCHSEFEYKMSDKEIKYIEGDRPWDSGSHYFTCPVCGDAVYVNRA